MSGISKTPMRKHLITAGFILLAVVLAVCAAGCVTPTETPTSGEALDEQLKNTPVSYVEANGIQFAYREFGDPANEPLVLLPGFTAVMDNWSGEFIYSLAEEYHVYTYDHRGMGYTKDNGEGYEFIQLADDCVAVMDALGYEKFNVLGHSMGSMATHYLLVYYPEHIDKAVLVSTVPTIYYPGAEFVRDLVIEYSTDEEKSQGIRNEAMAIINNNGVYDELKNVENDVLLIVGTADTVTPQEASLDVAGQIDGSWLIRIKDSSHAVSKEMPLECAESVKLFLGTEITYTP